MSYDYDAASGVDLGLDLSTTEAWEEQDYSIIPAGKYPVLINSAVVKQGRASGRNYLSVQYTITQGKFRKRVLFDIFALWADDPEYAKKRFKALRKAIGLNPNIGGNTAELPGKEFLASIRVRNKRNEPSEQENVVDGYLPLTGVPSQTQTAPQGQYAPQPQAAPVAPAAPSFPTPGQHAAPTQGSEGYPF